MAPAEPTEVVISDACCLIDLHQAGLLPPFFSLPYRFWMPDLVFAELTSFSVSERETLLQLGLDIRSLSGTALASAISLQTEKPSLSWQECSAFVLAVQTPSSILLTSDQSLRLHAQAQGQRVHGLLWVVDQFDAHQLLSRKVLRQVLQVWLDSPLVFLPSQALLQRLETFSE